MRRTFYLVSQEIIGDCPSVRQLKKQLWSNIFTYKLDWYLSYLFERLEDFSTLLLGETGVGKTSVASIIGCSGFIPYDLNRGYFTENFLDVFQSINLSEFPASLVESELFGHAKGAFTGAIDAYKGILELCGKNGGIFIDELGEISADLQVKFLNVLQDRVFTPVGSHKEKRFDGRIIGATNRNIHDLVREAVPKSGFFSRPTEYPRPQHSGKI